MTFARSTRLRATAPVSLQSVLLADTPLGYWRMNDAAGASTLVDTSGNGYDGTVNGSVLSGSQPKNPRLGTCALFTTTGFLSVADSSPFRLLSDFSISFWVRAASTLTSGQQNIIAMCGGPGETQANNVAWLVELRNNSNVQQLRFNHENGAGVDNEVLFTIAHTHTIWNHIGAVRDATAKNWTVYLNGAQFGQTSYSNNPDGASTATFNLGKNFTTGTISSVDRWLDEVAIYSSKLTAARVFEHYRAGRR